MKKRQKVEVDLKKHSEPVVHTDESLGVHLPADIPIHLRAFRLMADVKRETDARPVSGLTGWTVMLDCFTMGVKVYVRVGRDGTLKLFTEDETGREMVTKWENEP